MRRIAAAAFAIAALIILLIDIPAPSTTITNIKIDINVASPTQVEAAKGICEGVWTGAPEYRFMVNDVVVHEPRFGPEVKGRTVPQVLQELTERLCTDGALLYDLRDYMNNGFNAAVSPDRNDGIIAINSQSRERREQVVGELLSRLNAGSAPTIQHSKSAHRAWYYIKGATPADVPRRERSELKSADSDLLVWTGPDGKLRALRLQCGFQPWEGEKAFS